MRGWIRGGLIGLVCVTLWMGFIQAGETALTNRSDIENNSTNDGVAYTLNPNANGYRVQEGIIINTWGIGNIVLDDPGTNLYINHGNPSDNHRLVVKDFILGSSDLYTTGGYHTTISYTGLEADNFYTLAGTAGNIYASTSETGLGCGIKTDYFLHEGSGTITVIGSDQFAAIDAKVFETAGASGDIIANAGKSAGSVGIFATEGFTHQGSGTIEADGGNVSDSHEVGGYGIFAIDYFKTNGDSGDIIARGNQGSGILVAMPAGVFEHRGSGTITAIGNSSNIDNSLGTGIQVLGDFITHAGSGKLIAIGGAVGKYSGGSGLYTGTLSADNTVEMLRNGAPSSIYVSPNVGGADDIAVLFGANSTLVPFVDLSKTDDLAAGLLIATEGIVKIESGATLAPELINTASLEAGEQRSIPFIHIGYGLDDVGDGRIDGEFSNFLKPTLTFEYELVAEKSDDDRTYYLKFGKTKTPVDVVTEHGYCSSNTRRLLDALESGLNGVTGPEAATLNALYDQFATFSDPLDLAKYATDLSLNLTPQAFTRLTGFMLRQEEAMQNNLLGRVAGFRRDHRRWTTAADDCRTSSRDWTVWVDPLYHKAWKHRSVTCGFVKTEESFGGVSLGAAKILGDLTLSGQLHYLRGDVEGHGYDTDSDTWGALLSARYDFTTASGSATPWLRAVLGYSYSDHDQKRRDYLDNWHKSSPDAHLFRAGLHFGVDLFLGCNVVVTPHVGADYTHLHQENYREGDAGNLGLRVSAENFNSFRPTAGIELNARVTEKLTLSGKAKYHYEAADNRVRLRTSFLSVPSVSYRFKGEDIDRSAGNLGVGMQYQVTENINLHGGYDLWLEDHYIGHQFSAGLGVSF